MMKNTENKLPDAEHAIVAKSTPTSVPEIPDNSCAPAGGGIDTPQLRALGTLHAQAFWHGSLDQQRTAWGTLIAHIDADRARTPQAAPAAEKRRCKTCNSTRPGATCWKCGGPTFVPHSGAGDDPALPPIDRIRELAREVGYAIGVHGSLERDLDVIAAPWTDDAVGNHALMRHIAAGLTTPNGPARIIETERKPNGRYAAMIQMDGWFKNLDISVCPSAPTPPEQPAPSAAWHCDTHGAWDSTASVCPHCVREMRGQIKALRAALERIQENGSIVFIESYLDIGLVVDDEL